MPDFGILSQPLDTKHAEGVTTATIALLKPYNDKVFTITADNGKEFAGHELIAQELGADVYFAHPYSSWERGLNENTNVLIRQYFPKGSSFEEITDEQVETVMRIASTTALENGWITKHLTRCFLNNLSAKLRNSWS